MMRKSVTSPAEAGVQLVPGTAADATSRAAPATLPFDGEGQAVVASAASVPVVPPPAPARGAWLTRLRSESVLSGPNSQPPSRPSSYFGAATAAAPGTPNASTGSLASAAPAPLDDFVTRILAGSTPLETLRPLAPTHPGGGPSSSSSGYRSIGSSAAADYETGLLADSHRDHSSPRGRGPQLSLSPGGSPGSSGLPKPSPAADENAPIIANAQPSHVSLMRYALLFINFTFIVASLLMIMGGIVARTNAAVQLCEHCGQLSLVPVVLGCLMWLTGMIAFNWIRQRQVLFLMFYVGEVILVTLVLLVVFFVGIGIDRATAAKFTDGSGVESWLDRMRQWNQTVEEHHGGGPLGEAPLCKLQRDLNCSGYGFSCCWVPDANGSTAPWAPDTVPCYNVSAGTPAWVATMCPTCPGTVPAPRVCTDLVKRTVARTLGGFVVTTGFSIALTAVGIVITVVCRQLAKGGDAPAGS